MFDAIQQGNYFISFDEWEDEDRPPKNIWLDSEKLKAHVEEIRRKYKHKSEGEDVEDGPMEQNDLIKDLVRG